MKKVFKFAGAILKGAAKSFPLGNAVIGSIEGVTGKDVATGEPKQVNWQVIVIEVVAVVGLVYLVAKGIIPVEPLLDILHSIFK
jgi:hypothetical protein